MPIFLFALSFKIRTYSLYGFIIQYDGIVLPLEYVFTFSYDKLRTPTTYLITVMKFAYVYDSRFIYLCLFELYSGSNVVHNLDNSPFAIARL